MSYSKYSDDPYYTSYQSGTRDTSSEFTRLAQSVSTNIQKITKNVAEIQTMVSRIGTNQDNQQLRDKLHNVQHYTGQLAKDTNKLIREISSVPPPDNQSDQRQRKMQKERLANEFTSALNNFQAAQRHAAEKERESIARAKSTANDQFFDRKSEDLLNFDSSPTQQNLQLEQDVDLQILQEREQAIQQLECDINDVNQIFKDLGMLVHEQGEIVDSIESSVENAVVHVEQGKDQLLKAKEYKNKTRRKKFICLVIVVVVVIIISIILAYEFRKDD